MHHGVFSFPRWLPLLLVAFVPVGYLNAGTYGVAGSLPGSPFHHTGGVGWTVTSNGDGNVTVTCTSTSSSYDTEPDPTVTDARMLIDFFGAGALSVGQSAVYPEGATILIYVQVNYAGWQILGAGKSVTLGAATFRVPYNYTNDTIYEVELRWYKIDNLGPQETASHTLGV